MRITLKVVGQNDPVSIKEKIRQHVSLQHFVFESLKNTLLSMISIDNNILDVKGNKTWLFFRDREIHKNLTSRDLYEPK